jgi:hypothetical protein
LENVSFDAIAMENLNAWVNSLEQDGYRTAEEKIGAIQDVRLGGGIRMLFSYVVMEHPLISELPENLVRYALFRSAEETSSRQKIISAGAQYGTVWLVKKEQYSESAIEFARETAKFQEKLLQRITPSEPQTRK